MTTLSAVDVQITQQWREFFMTVGGASAALTGLVFVALSLNLGAAVRDATHRYRAIGTLSGITAAFVICVLALMGGQGHVAVGVEWALVATIAAFVYVRGYVRALRIGNSHVGLQSQRVAIGSVGYLAEIAGAIALGLGLVAGLYVAAIAMVLMLAFMISGAWLLVTGTSQSGPPDNVTAQEHYQ